MNSPNHSDPVSIVLRLIHQSVGTLTDVHQENPTVTHQRTLYVVHDATEYLISTLDPEDAQRLTQSLTAWIKGMYPMNPCDPPPPPDRQSPQQDRT